MTALKCPHCPVSFSTWASYSKHLEQEEHPEPLSLGDKECFHEWRCDNCGERMRIGMRNAPVDAAEKAKRLDPKPLSDRGIGINHAWSDRCTDQCLFKPRPGFGQDQSKYSASPKAGAE